MHDQADQLRKLVRASVQADATLAPGCPVVAISGAQPAVGVTTIACGLARELARLGKQVLLIDANLNNPRITPHLKQTQTTSSADSPAQTGPGPRGTLSDVLTGKRRAVEVLTPTAEEGVTLLAGAPPACRGSAVAGGLAPHRTPPPLNREALDRFAAETAALSRQVDVVLIDAGAGMNAWIDRLWQLAHQVLLVSTSSPQSLLDAYTAVKLAQFQLHDGKIRLLTNGAADQDEAAPLAARFEETCQRFLFITPKPAMSLPTYTDRPANSRSPQRQHGRDDFPRAVRLLAADLAGDFRVAALRLVRPKSNGLHSSRQISEQEGFSQRR